MAKKSGKFEKSIVTIIAEFDGLRLERDVARMEAASLHDALSEIAGILGEKRWTDDSTLVEWATSAKVLFSLE